MAYLAPNLAAIRQSIWAAYGKAIQVGWIGDSKHAATKSDHNPDSKGCVHAIDPMYSSSDSRGLTIVNACIGRPDLAYVIHNRKIWSASRGWAVKAYSGSDPHTNHVHISGKYDSASENRLIGILLSGVTPVASPVSSATGLPESIPVFPGQVARGSRGSAVTAFQGRLYDRGWKVKVDGVFGPAMEAVVRKFQAEKGLTVDGIAGRLTWRALWASPITA